MKEVWIAPYHEKVNGPQIHLPGNNSCSVSLVEALGFAIPEHQSSDKLATLFVIGCQNYKRIDGFFLNSEAYSSYPREKEVLLCDGCDMFILAVDSGIKIKNSSGGQMRQFND